MVLSSLQEVYRRERSHFSRRTRYKEWRLRISCKAMKKALGGITERFGVQSVGLLEKIIDLGLRAYMHR
jgi:hypothetical protein